MEWLGILANLFGILGSVFAFFAWIQARRNNWEYKQEQKRLNQKIKVVLQKDQERIDLPVELRRSELSRSEVLGLIGMIPMKEKGKRFALTYLNNPDFLGEIDRISQSKQEEELIIKCNEGELEQFDILRRETIDLSQEQA